MSETRKLDIITRAEHPLTPSGPTAVVHDSGRGSWLTYEAFYGMKEKPFALSSDPRFFYHSPSHAAAFEDLLAGIRRRESLSVLCGDIGTGKSTLCRAVLQCLDRQTFSAFVPDPFASRVDLLKVVLMEFGVISVDDLTSGRLNGVTRTELSYLLYEFLGRLAPLQAFAVVVIDEAQNLSLPLLEELRILSDSDGRERQLQIVLVGQLELQQKLKLPEMRQVEQRIPVRTTLGPLNREGVSGYVAHRLRVAGASPDRVSFSEAALDALYASSGGVPRLINRICDRALHYGHLTRAAKIEALLVETAAADVGSDRVSRSAVAPAAPAAASSEPAAADAPATVRVSHDVPAPIDLTPKPAAAAPARPAPIVHAVDTSAERVSEWLTDVDVEVAKTLAMPRTNDTLPIDQGDEEFLRAVARVKEKHWDASTEPVPQTFLERTVRRWLRWLSMAMLRALVVGGIMLALAYMWRSAAPSDEEMEPELPSAPELSMAAPAVPAALPDREPPAQVPPQVPAAAKAEGGHIIQVTLLRNEARAADVVDALSRDGYPAYQSRVSLREGDVRHQVLAGPYATREEADVDLDRLHGRPDFKDARIVASSRRPEQ